MLDLAGAAGAVLLSEMARRRLLNDQYGLRVYMYNDNGDIIYRDIINGNPRYNLWLSDQHFRAIV